MQCIFCFSETWNGVCPVCEQRARGKNNRSLKRHHRQRYIKKRSRIVMEIWKTTPHFPLGQLSKYNLSCNCWCCKYEKKAGITKPKYRTRVHFLGRDYSETYSDNISCYWRREDFYSCRNCRSSNPSEFKNTFHRLWQPRGRFFKSIWSISTTYLSHTGVL